MIFLSKEQFGMHIATDAIYQMGDFREMKNLIISAYRRVPCDGEIHFENYIIIGIKHITESGNNKATHILNL